MLINYWDCKFQDYVEIWDGETETRIYLCTSPESKTRCCECDNKWSGDKDECPIAKEDK